VQARRFTARILQSGAGKRSRIGLAHAQTARRPLSCDHAQMGGGASQEIEAMRERHDRSASISSRPSRRDQQAIANIHAPAPGRVAPCAAGSRVTLTPKQISSGSTSQRAEADQEQPDAR